MNKTGTALQNHKEGLAAAAILVADPEGPLALGFDDLKKFHGTRSLCGLTVGFTILRAAWQHLSGRVPKVRDTIRVESGFPGPGARDAFEMVTRAVSRDCYTISTAVSAGPLIAEAARGVYWFKISDDGGSVTLSIKPAAVPAGFVPLRRKLLAGGASSEEALVFRRMQHAFSSHLLTADLSETVHVISVDPAKSGSPE